MRVLPPWVAGEGRGPSGSRSGFSLIEILAAVVLLGIAVSIAAPQVADISRRMQVDSAAQQVLGALERARTEAIKRNRAVKVTFGEEMYTIQYVGARTLEGARFASAPDSVKFAPFGPPQLGGATFVVEVGTHSETVVLDAAGHATVQ
ncbi:MAG: GspH/FimT family pseudopilin [Gemmatimonadota bacterium]|nr:GspH/FimT family pseudopilin [Gemmatimonadota bacterium]